MVDEIILGEQFKMGKKLGKGSFGEIFLGINRNTNDLVAIKIVRES